jgi:hypothetical protein
MPYVPPERVLGGSPDAIRCRAGRSLDHRAGTCRSELWWCQGCRAYFCNWCEVVIDPDEIASMKAAAASAGEWATLFKVVAYVVLAIGVCSCCRTS